MKLVLKNSWTNASERMFGRVESKFNITFPEEYRNFLLKQNGGQPSPSTFLVGNTKHKLSLFFSIGGKPEMDISNRHKNHISYVNARFSTEEREDYDGFLTIAEDDQSNPIFIGTKGDSEGRIYFLEKRKKENIIVCISESLTEFISNFQSSGDDTFIEDGDVAFDSVGDEEAPRKRGRILKRKNYDEMENGIDDE